VVRGKGLSDWVFAKDHGRKTNGLDRCHSGRMDWTKGTYQTGTYSWSVQRKESQGDGGPIRVAALDLIWERTDASTWARETLDALRTIEGGRGGKRRERKKERQKKDKQERGRPQKRKRIGLNGYWRTNTLGGDKRDREGEG
jgi:hypothetical protein